MFPKVPEDIVIFTLCRGVMFGRPRPMDAEHNDTGHLDHYPDWWGVADTYWQGDSGSGCPEEEEYEMDGTAQPRYLSNVVPVINGAQGKWRKRQGTRFREGFAERRAESRAGRRANEKGMGPPQGEPDWYG